jgi:hypothetical protein
VRVAVIVVSMLVVTTPSEASKSCMSKTEARQHFGAVHIYWHGKEHCWDATPTRRPQHRTNNVQRKIDQPKWRESMLLLPKEEPAISPKEIPAISPKEEPVPTWIDRWVDTEPPSIASRWVDIVQVAPPPIIRKPKPMVPPRDVVMVIIVVTLTLAIVMMFERAISRRSP